MATGKPRIMPLCLSTTAAPLSPGVAKGFPFSVESNVDGMSEHSDSLTVLWCSVDTITKTP